MILFNYGKEIYFTGKKLSIQRCFNNLIENSIKFANKIKLILISLKIIFSYILKTITRYTNFRKRMCKPFYKIDESRSQKSSSVGLGLSISSDI